MGKKQKSVSIPEKEYETLERLLKEHEDVLSQWNIDSVPKLLMVLQKRGVQVFLEDVGELRKLRNQKAKNPQAPRSPSKE